MTGVDYGQGSKITPFEATQGPVSKFHYLIPAAKPSLELCYNLLSSAANRFPVPTLVGYNATADSHHAVSRLRTIAHHLDQLGPENDNDLVLIADGHGVVVQLPAEVLIERYFEARKRSEVIMAQRLGLSVDDACARGMRQTLFWGPDMRCSPDDPSAARCWAVPESGVLSDDPRTKNGRVTFHDVRYLNAGTAMGPVGEMRTLMAAALAEMEEQQQQHDAQSDLDSSEQYHVSNLFGRQEYYRTLNTTGREPQGGPDNRRIPEKQHEDQQTEHHMAVDYKSILFQPRSGGYGAFLSRLRFSRPGFKARVDSDVFGQGEDFVPRDMHMPTNVRYALVRLYDSIPRAHPGQMARSWVGAVELGVNLVANHIYAVWHCSSGADDSEGGGSRQLVPREAARMWWYRYARSLVKATVRAFQNGELITHQLMDGRQWAPKMAYPDRKTLRDELGGAWTDSGSGDGKEFVEWETLCGRYGEELFAGEDVPAMIMASGDL